MKLVIDRSKWLRGEGADKSALLRVADEKMCCLGFYGLACGLTAVELRGIGAPYAAHAESWPAWLIRWADIHPNPSASCCALMGTNDSLVLDEPSRESRVAAEFAKHGVEVEFV